MFSKNTFAFAFLFLFVAQGVLSYTVQREQDIIDDLIKKAKEAIDHLAQEIDDAVKKGEAKLKEYWNDIVADVTSFEDKAKKEIANIFEDVKEHAEKLIKDAELLGANATICLEEHKDDLEHLPLDIIFKMSECLTDELTKLENLINGVVADCKEYYNKITDLPEQLKECIADQNAATCISQLIDDVVKDTTTFIGEIKDIISDAINMILNIKTDLKNCAIEKLKEAAKEAAELAEVIGQCVADRIHH